MASFPTDAQLDEMVFRVGVRYRPEELDKLAKKTKFTRQEIQIIYRGFKQGCPTGMIDEDSFVEIFTQFFPQGDATQYAHFVFNNIRGAKSGMVNFEEFLYNLSHISRGSLEDKLRWVFGLYDLNSDGRITRSEMLTVVNAVYDMLGPYTDPAVEEKAISEHVDRTFESLDRNKDGFVTFDELIEYITSDANKRQSLEVLDTVL